nr:unnamed protein product [Callosobruchus analis]
MFGRSDDSSSNEKSSLASKEDIKKLYIHVKTIAKVSQHSKRSIQSCCMDQVRSSHAHFLMLFNRRRAGEIERLL